MARAHDLELIGLPSLAALWTLAWILTGCSAEITEATVRSPRTGRTRAAIVHPIATGVEVRRH